ncbi:ArgE/DapE family deacylase [Peribacillus sp. TH27]|uniref:ArgE/DapE family deacylase n=1 Tax=Peribacillus sp. TH27 TaxID=2798484 RepID=UPI0019149866|nr:ArgE/DapE family deacylase [Peribacillus sp. TH27]
MKYPETKESVEVELTKTLISYRPVTSTEINSCMDYCSKWLQEHGLVVEVLENKGLKIIVANLPNNCKDLPKVILNGHIDVVPGGENVFKPKIENGKLFGRGSYDMLGAVATMMIVMSDLTKKDSLKYNVSLVLVPDEEKGGQDGTKFLVDNGYLGDFVICGEPTNYDISIQSKGVLQVEITVKGKSAHASRPWLGENAIEKAMDTYKKIKSLKCFEETNAFFSEKSFNLSTINGGSVINQVPDECSFELDIRLLPDQSVEEIFNLIKSEVPNIKISLLRRGEPVMVDENNIFLNRLKTIANKVTKGDIRFIGQYGTADTRFYSEYGVAAVEFGPVGAGHHGPDEFVYVQSLNDYRKILNEFILN